MSLWIKGLILIVLTTLNTQAQTLEFKNYSTKEGLLTDEVYKLHQDKQGYLWIFSPLGTLKYNGSEFKPVLKNLPIKESFIYSVYENKAGRKWVANSNARIYEIRNDSAIFIKGIEQVSEQLKRTVNEIGKLAVDDSLNIYAITKGHSYKFVKTASGYWPVDLSGTARQDSLKIKIVEAGTELLEISDRFKHDEFNLDTIKQIYLQVVNANRFYKLAHSKAVPVHSFKKFNNCIYFIYDRHIARIEKSGNITTMPFPSVIVSYTKDKRDHLWVGCLNDGLYELNEHDSITGHYLKGITINCLLIDHQGGLWASTPESGLYRCANLKNLSFNPTEPLGSPLSFIKKLDEKLFIATKNGNLFAVNGNRWTWLRKSDNASPLDIAAHNKEYILLFKMFVEKLKLSKTAGISKLFPKTGVQYNVYVKSADTVIYTWKRGITYFIKGIAKKRIDFGCKILSSQLIDNILWLGTESGAYRYCPVFTEPGEKPGDILLPDKDTLVIDHALNTMQNASVIQCVKDNGGNIWFCTRGDGIFKLAQSRLVNYTRANGLPGDIINGISCTEDNSILLATNEGLFISGIDKNGAFTGWKTIYTGNVMTALAFEKRIYASVKNGLVIIDKSDDKKREDSVFFNLASIQIDAKEILSENFKALQSAQNSIAFKFDVITFAGVKPTVKYVLHGSLSDSGFVTDALIKFDRLTPGNYTLSAFPFLKGGEKLKLSIPFYVTPGFWQTTLFKVLIFIFILLAIILSSWLIIYFNRKKMAVKTKNEQLLLEYKLIALKAQINPHFMSNCLLAIQHLVKSNETGKATSYIAKFGHLVRQILDFSSRPVIQLREELDLLGVYLELEQLRFENKFTYAVNIENEGALLESFVPPLILNPIIENAIWHGLLPIKGQREGKLLIEIKLEKNSLMISIEDNGVGRDPGKMQISGNKSKSYGMKITEQRLINLNYLYKRKEAKIIYNDLKDKFGQAAGTQVIIYLPLNLKPKNHDEN